MTTKKIEATVKRSAGLRLRRVEGQVRGLMLMLANDTPPADVMLQLKAAEAALAAVRRLLLVDVLRSGDSTLAERLL